MGERFYKAFLRSTHDTASIATVEEGRFIDVSDSLQELLGRTRDEIIGHTAIELGFWADPRERKEMVRILKAQKRVRNLEIHFVDCLGRLRTGLFQAEAIDLGGVPCLIAVTDDITERMEAEKALKESEEFLSNVLNNSPQPILVLNEDSSIRYVNPALERITNLTSQDLIGLTYPYPWYPESTKHQSNISGCQDVLKTTVIEEQLLCRSNGDCFWVDRHIVPIKATNNAKYCLETWVDITERKRFKENLEYYIHAITQAQEEERKRLSRVIHDQTVQDLARLLIDIDSLLSIENLSDKATASLEDLVSKVTKMMDETRRFSHDLRPGLLEHFGLVPAVKLLFEELEQDTKALCRIEVVDDKHRLSADAEILLYRVVQEALQNIRKHSKATEVLFRMRIEDEITTIEIIDNGVGFKLPQNIESLARERRLGLIGMRERVKLLGGKLEISSKPGKGMALIARVPISPV